MASTVKCRNIFFACVQFYMRANSRRKKKLITRPNPNGNIQIIVEQFQKKKRKYRHFRLIKTNQLQQINRIDANYAFNLSRVLHQPIINHLKLNQNTIFVWKESHGNEFTNHFDGIFDFVKFVQIEFFFLFFAYFLVRMIFS